MLIWHSSTQSETQNQTDKFDKLRTQFVPHKYSTNNVFSGSRAVNFKHSIMFRTNKDKGKRSQCRYQKHVFKFAGEKVKKKL